MRHVFRATKFGWDREQDGIWFDSSEYTEHEARAQFSTYQAMTKDGYPYTGYEFEGEKYHDVTYVGEYEDDEMPTNNDDVIAHMLNNLD
ncbi:hypothetical protein [Actinomyces gerencseriae]|jgi:hypothetical protein